MMTNEEILKEAKASFKIEGIEINNEIEKMAKNCLLGKSSFDKTKEKIIEKYKNEVIKYMYIIKCNKCGKQTGLSNNTDELFIKARHEGFKIEHSVEPLNKIDKSGSTIKYSYECPNCKSSYVNLQIIDVDNKEENIKYLYSKTSNIDKILSYVEKTEKEFKNYQEIYNNDKVDSGKKNITIFKSDDERYFIRIMRIIDDTWMNIGSYLKDDEKYDEFYDDEYEDSVVFNMDTVYDLMDQEYDKNVLYNFYVVECKTKKDLINFCNEKLNNKEVFDINNKLKNIGGI